MSESPNPPNHDAHTPQATDETVQKTPRTVLERLKLPLLKQKKKGSSPQAQPGTEEQAPRSPRSPTSGGRPSLANLTRTISGVSRASRSFSFSGASVEDVEVQGLRTDGNFEKDPQPTTKELEKLKEALESKVASGEPPKLDVSTQDAILILGGDSAALGFQRYGMGQRFQGKIAFPCLRTDAHHYHRGSFRQSPCHRSST